MSIHYFDHGYGSSSSFDAPLLGKSPPVLWGTSMFLQGEFAVYITFKRDEGILGFTEAGVQAVGLEFDTTDIFWEKYRLATEEQ